MHSLRHEIVRGCHPRRPKHPPPEAPRLERAHVGGRIVARVPAGVECEGDGELAPALLRQRELAGGGGEELLVLGGLAGEQEERGGGWGSAAAAMLGCRSGSGDPVRTSVGRLASAGGGSNRSSAAADRLGYRRRLVLE